MNQAPLFEELVEQLDFLSEVVKDHLTWRQICPEAFEFCDELKALSVVAAKIKDSK